MKFHPLAILSVVTFILTITLALWISYLLWYPDNLIIIKNSQSLPVSQLTYNTGDRIVYTLDYCKTRNITGSVSRALVDDYRLTFEDVNSNLETGCHVVKINEIVIPEFTQPGTYHLEITGTYQINVLRKLVVELRTVNFNIIKSQTLNFNITK